jgi:hypothetical protein
VSRLAERLCLDPGVVTLTAVIGTARSAATDLTHEKVAGLLTPPIRRWNAEILSDGTRFCWAVAAQSAVDLLDEVVSLLDQAVSARESRAKTKTDEALAERAKKGAGNR